MNSLEKTPFIGRQDLMDWLVTTIFGAAPSGKVSEVRPSTPLVLIYGISGIGKTTACQHFVSLRLSDPPEDHPLVAFDWKGGYQVRSVLRFAQMLFEMGATNMRLPNNQGLVVIGVTGDFSPDLAQDDSSEQTYTEEGLAAEDPIPLQVLNDDESEKLASDFVERMVDWLGQTALDPSMQILGKVIFVFDEFEQYPVSVRRWVGRHLYPALNHCDKIPPCAFIFTSHQPWDRCSFIDYWDLPAGVLKEYELEPMTDEECALWLAHKGLGEDYLETLIEETEGVPGRIESLLLNPDRLREIHEGSEMVGPLPEYDARERRWLHAASMVEVVSYERLELLLGAQEAKAASDWLAKQKDICRVEIEAVEGKRAGSIALNPDYRKLILSSSKKKIPIRHRQYASKIKLLDEIAEHVPASKHRRYLGMLSPVQPLSQEVIQYVFGEDR